MITIEKRMLEDLLFDPVKAAWVFFRIRLDAFQQARLRVMWFTPDVEDSSGFSSGKTIVDWVVVNLSAVLIPNTHIGVFYQTFQTGKESFWQYYNQFSTDLFRAQLGRLDAEGEEQGKAQGKDPGCWKQYFRNGSVVAMPAPGFASEAKNMASLRFNRLLIDEWTKIMSSESGMAAVTKQLMGRVTRACFNQHHPVWSNKVWRTATAELGSHPAYQAHREFEREMRRGNPDFWSMRFCYKDYSNLPCHSGRSFKEEFRQEKRIKALKVANTPEKVRAEVLGIWSRCAKGWYSQMALDACQELGRRRGLDPVCSRVADPTAGENTRYFLGVDPAPSQGHDSDEGALAVLRARPAADPPGPHESDWILDFVWMRVLRKADAEQWSGLIHEKHQDFGFDMILMDLGGGGQWIAPELRKPRQNIRDATVECKPITGRSAPSIEGDMILVMLSRGEESIKALWPELKHAHGDDVLKDGANTMFQTALTKGTVGLPVRHQERQPAPLWVEERVWASRLLGGVLPAQAMKVNAETNEDGSWRLTRNNARIFRSSGRDDLVDAARNAYVAFRIWLLGCDADWAMGAEDAALGDSR